MNLVAALSLHSPGLQSRGGSDATTTVTIPTTTTVTVVNHHRAATQPRYHRHPPLPSSSSPLLAPIPRGYLVLLPSSGISIESTGVVNYLLMRRRHAFQRDFAADDDDDEFDHSEEALSRIG